MHFIVPMAGQLPANGRKLLCEGILSVGMQDFASCFQSILFQCWRRAVRADYHFLRLYFVQTDQTPGKKTI